MAKDDPANSGGKFSGLMRALWNPKRREFLGRDGAGWGKLGVFYFFFYVGLAGFFCSMLAVFMALTPRDRPRYYSESSRMRTRSTDLSPGLGFRPQPDGGNNLISFTNEYDSPDGEKYANNLDKFLALRYPQSDRAQNDDDNNYNNNNNNNNNYNKYDNNQNRNIGPRNEKFTIEQPRECTSENRYGYRDGRPCVLVKMNKIVGFTPIPGHHRNDKNTSEAFCRHSEKAVALHCFGEYAADKDNIGEILYHSERGIDRECGSLEKNRFPYEGKYNRQDFYQAPYVWVQFRNPTPNVLINVVCRVYGQNIEFERKTARGLTRFQIYLRKISENTSSRN